MDPKEFIEIVKVANSLKLNTRHCWTIGDRKESIADHSWRIAFMAMLLDGEGDLKDVDMDRVIRMCLIHDFGEAFTGDIPAWKKTKDDSDVEDDELFAWVDTLPEHQKEEWLDLLKEMKAMETKEAKTYKALDRIEALISHNESDISTWLDHEYDLQFTYGQENMEFSELFKEIRKEIDDWSKEKIETEKRKD